MLCNTHAGVQDALTATRRKHRGVKMLLKPLVVVLLAVWWAWPAPEIYDIESKTALVTGASSGLGVDIALKLASEGASKVAICARRLSKLQEVKVRIEEEYPGVEVFTYSCDLSKEDSIEALRKGVMSDLGHLDILVQNAGVENFYYFEKDTVQSISQQMNVNCLGTLLVVHSFLSGMIERGSGTVIVMSSLSGKIGTPYMVAYSANRHCTKGFAAALRSEMNHRKTGVVVSSLHPGFVKGAGMYADLLAKGLPPSHWSFGSAGTADDIGGSVVNLIKTGENELLVNSPHSRPNLVLDSLFPSLFTDVFTAYFPSTWDPVKTWAQARMIRDGVRY